MPSRNRCGICGRLAVEIEQLASRQTIDSWIDILCIADSLIPLSAASARIYTLHDGCQTRI